MPSRNEDMPWIDSEVHLLPPEWCRTNYAPPVDEVVLRRVVYDHPERDAALAGAHVDGLLAEMQRSGIQRAVITGLPWRDLQRCRRNNAYLGEIVQRFPERFVGLAVMPDPADCDATDEVRRALDLGLAGIKVIPSWHGRHLDEPVYAALFEALVERDMLLMTHTDHAIEDPGTSDTPFSLLQVARRWPQLRILAPHLGGLLCLYNLYAPVSKALDNILWITTVPKTMDMVVMAVRAVGAERVAFGTDFPFNPSHDQLSLRRELEQLPLDDRQRRLIAGASAARFLEGRLCAS